MRSWPDARRYQTTTDVTLHLHAALGGRAHLTKPATDTTYIATTPLYSPDYQKMPHLTVFQSLTSTLHQHVTPLTQIQVQRFRCFNGITGLAHCHPEPLSSRYHKQNCNTVNDRSKLNKRKQRRFVRHVAWNDHVPDNGNDRLNTATATVTWIETQRSVEQPYGTAAATILKLAPPNALTPSFASLCDVDMPHHATHCPLHRPCSPPPEPRSPPTDVPPPLFPSPFSLRCTSPHRSTKLYHAPIPLIYT